MGAKVTIRRDNLPKLKAALDKLRTARVMVGIPGGGSPHEGSDLTNAELGYIHEFGAPEANIPARPFLVPGVRNATDAIVKRMRDAGRAVLAGNEAAVDANLDAAGLVAQTAVKAKINEGVPPPLKPGTLAARRRKGATGDKPLIRTGALRDAVIYVIRRGVKAPGE